MAVRSHTVRTSSYNCNRDSTLMYPCPGSEEYSTIHNPNLLLSDRSAKSVMSDGSANACHVLIGVQLYRCTCISISIHSILVPCTVLVGVSYLVLPDYRTRYYCSKDVKLVGCSGEAVPQEYRSILSCTESSQQETTDSDYFALYRVQVLVIHHSRERMEVAVHYVRHTIARAPLKQQCRTSRSGRQDETIPVTQFESLRYTPISTSSCSIRQRQLHWRAQPPWGQRWHHQESMPPFPHH